MKERPIIFSGEMVRAILEGRKTQTRRAIKPQPPKGHWWAETEGDMQLAAIYYPGERGRSGCPYGVPGDRLWVREAWQHCPRCGGINWRACGNENGTVCQHCDESLSIRWKSPIHMFKDYARIWLEITGVRMERLQDITMGQIAAEGVSFDWCEVRPYPEKVMLQRKAFRELWNSLNAKRGYGWEANPWVWAVQFETAEAKSQEGRCLSVSISGKLNG